MTLRVASLLPSATEIVAALGAADALVARSHECDHPPGIERLPALTEARIDAAGASADIHRRMEDALRDVLSVYRVDADRLRALAPDVIVTQAQCEVCAVSEDEVRRVLAEWGEGGAALVSLTATDLAGVYDDIRRVARALGREDEGARLAAAMGERIAKLGCAAAEAGWKPRLALIEWMEPPMAGGNWMPELAALAGAEPLFAEPGKHSPWIAWEDLRAADPDAILIAPCGFDIARTLGDLAALTGRPGWADLRAVRAGRVAVADGNAYFNRPGPRLADTLEILAEFLHPEIFDFGHEGRAFLRLFPG
jgi:iron complex transport system substrate-binding protein